MTFDDAGTFVMKFGKRIGETLDEIARTDDGLRYLDWLAGSNSLWPDTREALDTYLSDPSIKRELDSVLGG